MYCVVRHTIETDWTNQISHEGEFYCSTIKSSKLILPSKRGMMQRVRDLIAELRQLAGNEKSEESRSTVILRQKLLLLRTF
ncbi:hypothetical protein PNK_1083 [Candidatus Protochlamydia naegleriophila]|uniref:Uncharacterized protein n=1 Tax=Candidatus Protochlamydia naegleriophila TaxID=389348 RepID=A0A0U5CPN5_9BACT|nr:hypothetical protein PNK_1083 [Candidatus Protochlamydia naegleriophila]